MVGGDIIRQAIVNAATDGEPWTFRLAVEPTKGRVVEHRYVKVTVEPITDLDEIKEMEILDEDPSCQNM